MSSIFPKRFWPTKVVKAEKSKDESLIIFCIECWTCLSVQYKPNIDQANSLVNITRLFCRRQLFFLFGSKCISFTSSIDLNCDYIVNLLMIFLSSGCEISFCESWSLHHSSHIFYNYILKSNFLLCRLFL